MRVRLQAVLAALSCCLVLTAGPARADFAEVSGPGERPFLLSKMEPWTWEDLSAAGLTGITYTVYRSTLPNGGFGAVRDGYRAPSWDGDPELPSEQAVSLFHYLVTANDRSSDSSAGSTSRGDERVVELPPRCSSGAAPLAEPVPLRLERAPDRFGQPTFLTAEPSRGADLFVVDRVGRVRVRRDGAFLPTPFLDISTRVRTGGERGLLGFAFHPDFETNGLVYAHYSSSVITACGVLDRNHCAIISEFSLSADPDVVDAASERPLLQVGQPYENHDGGWIAFGPDRLLHVALGDGGGGGDPDRTGQDPTLLLGSLLRIDPAPDLVEGTPYTIPPDNPFVGHPVNRPEIFAYGLRNPWRNSFDRQTGDLYIADVGQDFWEEINVAPASDGGANGLNYGWNTMEASHCFSPAVGCDETGLTLPAVEYPHVGPFCSGSVTGGYVYRGCAMPFLHGTYFFSDYCLNRISSFVWDGAAATELLLSRPDLAGPSGVVSFGEDVDGELWILEADGDAWLLVPDF